MGEEVRVRHSTFICMAVDLNLVVLLRFSLSLRLSIAYKSNNK